LSTQKNKLQDIIDEILVIKSKNRAIKSDYFVNVFREAQDAVVPHLEKYDKKDLDIVYKTIGFFDFEPETLEAFNMMPEDEDLLKEWISKDLSIKFE